MNNFDMTFKRFFAIKCHVTSTPHTKIFMLRLDVKTYSGKRKIFNRDNTRSGILAAFLNSDFTKFLLLQKNLKLPKILFFFSPKIVILVVFNFSLVQKLSFCHFWKCKNNEKQLVPDRVLPRLIVLLFPYSCQNASWREKTEILFSYEINV